MEIKEFIGEVWRPVKDYEGRYEVSNFGRIRNPRTGKILKNLYKTCGYFYITLCKFGVKSDYRINRLVAIAYIPIPKYLKHIPIDKLKVNHKNENKLDNFVYVNEDGSVDSDKSNLEWCTDEYNSNYGTSKIRLSAALLNNPKKSYPVIQYTLDGEFIKKYPSIREAYRQTGIDRSKIRRICKGIIKQPKQFIWKYAND